MGPISEKINKKSIFSIYYKNKLCHGTWLFCLGNMLKNICFFSNFPLAGSMTGGFYWLSIWNFKR